MPRHEITHGHSTREYRSPTYQSWVDMKRRCTNTNCPDYRNYGGREISVCKRWGKFENFLSDMGERPHGTSLDRIDNDGDYKPSNCRWASQIEQVLNRRCTTLPHLGGGVAASKSLGFHSSTIAKRKAAGWPEHFLTAPRHSRLKALIAAYNEGEK